MDWKNIIGAVALAGVAGAPFVGEWVQGFAGMLALVYLVLQFWNPFGKQ